MLCKSFCYHTDMPKQKKVPSKKLRTPSVTLIAIVVVLIIGFAIFIQFAVRNSNHMESVSLRSDDGQKIEQVVKQYLSSINSGDYTTAHAMRSTRVKVIPIEQFPMSANTIKSELADYQGISTESISRGLVSYRALGGAYPNRSTYCYNYSGTLKYQNGDTKQIYATLREGKHVRFAIVDVGIFPQNSPQQPYSCREYEQ